MTIVSHKKKIKNCVHIKRKLHNFVKRYDKITKKVNDPKS